MAKGNKDGYKTDSAGMDNSGPSAGGLMGKLAFKSDPPFVNKFDDEALGVYTIFCPSTGSNLRGVNQDTAGDLTTYGARYPIIWDAGTGGGASVLQPRPGTEDQRTLVDQDLIGEVIFNQLDRIITTPGDINTEDLKELAREYIARATNCMIIWAQAAAMQGMALGAPESSGQMKNYLSSIGAKPWDMENMTSLMNEIPLPAALVSYYKDWHAVKQDPDGRSVFCVPSQPVGLTADETSTPTEIGNHARTFYAEYKRLQAIEDSNNEQIYPELRRIFMNAGWSLPGCEQSIPLMRDGKWWDIQVTNTPYLNRKSDLLVDQVQANPQAGEADRIYSLSVYSENQSPLIERLLMPVFGADSNYGGFSAQTGAFDTVTSGAGVTTFGWAYMGWQPLRAQFSNSASLTIRYSRPAILIVGQSATTDEIGWASDGITGSISGLTINDNFNAMYSEMASTLNADAGAAAGEELGLYEKIYQGKATTVSSNKYQFGNTIDPNMTGSTTSGFVSTTDETGDPMSLQRVYKAFLS